MNDIWLEYLALTGSARDMSRKKVRALTTYEQDVLQFVGENAPTTTYRVKKAMGESLLGGRSLLTLLWLTQYGLLEEQHGMFGARLYSITSKGVKALEGRK